MSVEILNGLNEKHLDRFEKQFVENNRTNLELLWVRTQQDGIGSRRRMINGLDKYEMKESKNGLALVISEPYAWYQTACPENEIKEYENILKNNLIVGNWIKKDNVYVLDDLVLEYWIKNIDNQDIKKNRTIETGYKIFEIEVKEKNRKITEQDIENRWNILIRGIRKKDERGNPKIINNIKEIQDFFPMQVELGCGPSTEAGIPPLHYFHTLYSVQEAIKATPILGPKKDNLLNDLVKDPKDFFRRSGYMYAKALTAEVTPFYKKLKELHDEGKIVGDIITNNFDGLAMLAGLKEKFVRR